MNTYSVTLERRVMESVVVRVLAKDRYEARELAASGVGELESPVERCDEGEWGALEVARYAGCPQCGAEVYVPPSRDEVGFCEPCQMQVRFTAPSANARWSEQEASHA